MLINKTTAVPRDRWLSIQILNRTNWTNYKQYLTESNRHGNIENLNLALCENCGEQGEHMDHIFEKCTLAKQVWYTIEKAITFSIRHTYCGESERLVTLPIKIEQANIIFLKPIIKSKLIED